MDFAEKRTLQSVFQYSISHYANEVAVGFVDEESITYKNFGIQATKMATSLIGMGVKKGDRIAILGENSPRWGIAYFAVAALTGAVIVPILPDFHKNEVHHIIRNSGSKILILSSKLAHKMAESKFKELEYIISLDDKPLDLKDYKIMNFDELQQGSKIKTSKVDLESIKIEQDDLMEILYTSGTTGYSKGVMLTNGNIISNAISARHMINIRANDRLLSILPMSHSYECTCGFIAPFSAGSKIYYIKGLPTAQTLLPAVAKIKPTIILSVPLIMDKIYKKKVVAQIKSKALSNKLYQIATPRKMIHRIAGRKLYKAFGGHLRFIVFGGAATPIEVEEFLTDGGFPYITGYGLTETAPILTVNPVGQVVQRSAGVVVPEVELRIDDPDPSTGIGEIVAKGPNIMRGYYRNEEATNKVFTEDGWLITGDKGYIDENGYLFIKGRSKNLIVGPSGENIYPEEIEFYFSQNTYVLESLVYDKEGKVVARVHLDFDAIDKDHNYYELDEVAGDKLIQELVEKIRQNVNAKVAAYSRVRNITVQREEFEKTPTKR